mmetsp:Transcript_3737/g.5109  ORF Transcript_3737/g.5109 Transcript_3737/m.5109 type:complete len:415 (+) Transcript_3737:50-1294(+)|eukprot:CAMPEP_0184871176 /NCGR_PEP_ID=MMETSP0580-20130426/40280_1 /TAXON_ID=1118495 /ORGANISM="Dactyliosolen fragilissimus" /LENGTH=414 /DNA_ID=CAMNT_0027373747 /DNA_START=39 /DNA_END=1283 /DNA_ORIENTATION=+
MRYDEQHIEIREVESEGEGEGEGDENETKYPKNEECFDNKIIEYNILPTDESILTSDAVQHFREEGYIIFNRPLLSHETVQNLNYRLENVLRGIYDLNRPPDKRPKLVKVPLPVAMTTHSRNKNEKAEAGGPLGYTGNTQNVRVQQIININKCDETFRNVALGQQHLGEMVSKLMGWSDRGVGARLAQDQIWAKPPGAPPLAYHRDSPYFMFEPPDVATVWISLDDLSSADLGPLEYVSGSHLWGDGRIGSTKNFFLDTRRKKLDFDELDEHKDHDINNNNDASYIDLDDLLRSAAEREGVDSNKLKFVTTLGMKAGGMSIHNGRTWHGSKGNKTGTRKDRNPRHEGTAKPRRGLGLHFVPSDVQWTRDAKKSSLWKKYVTGYVKEHEDGTLTELKDLSKLEVDLNDFPIVWMP